VLAVFNLAIALSIGAAEDPVRANIGFTTSEPNGGWTDNGYYVHNNIWNEKEGGPQTLTAQSWKSWSVTSTQPATTSVKSYPNVHKDIRDLEGEPLSRYRAIKSTFAGKGPGTGIYNFAYDLWLNGVGWGNGTTEFMVWTENHGQTPLGKSGETATFEGRSYKTWRFVDGEEGVTVITLVAEEPLRSGQLDLKEMLDWALAKGWIAANPTINQICYGVEICSTEGKSAQFQVTDFSVTME
jgi:hypothetical protein